MPRLPQGTVARLVEVAAQFARAHPAIAGMAGAFASDSSQERVREGLLFLGASVIDQVARFEADGHRSLADIVAPDLSRPFPAATIVQLSMRNAGVVQVPEGAELGRPGDAGCRFRLTQSLDVASARLHNCRAEPEQRMSLRFSLVADGGQPLARCVGRSLRLFIDEPRGSALLLLHHVLSHTARVEVRRSGGETSTIRGVQPFGVAESLLPTLDGVSNGASLVHEYFLFPEKFLLFDLGGIAEALRPDDTKATVIFRFDTPLPQRVRVSSSAFRANCTPAVNLFPTTAEPRLCLPAATSFPLRVAGLRPDQSSVYEVLEVTASDPATGASTVVSPARRFGAVALDDRLPCLFTTRLSDDAEPTTLLSLTSPRDRPPVLDLHVVSVGLLATNGPAGAQVKPGELSDPGAWMPPGVEVRNIVPTSPYVPALGSQAFILRTVTRGQVPRQDPLHVLQALLYSLVPCQAPDDTSARALTARVDAIEAFDLRPVADGERTRRGYGARLVLDESAFTGLGDVALFLRVVHQLLESRASVNRFFTCEALCTKSGERFLWPPRGAS